MMSKESYLRVYESAREGEYERVQRFIKDIKNDLIGAPLLLNFFAPKGFGKSALLQRIWVEYERVLPTSLIRMEDFYKSYTRDFEIRKLLKYLIQQFSQRLPDRNLSLSTDYESWESEKSLAELLLKVIRVARDYEKITLFLIDNYDTMPQEDRRWFQEHVLSPASSAEEIAVILTSETELRFTENFELRMRLEACKLASLDAKAITRALPEYEEIAGDIHRITGGLPILVEEFSEQLKESHIHTASDFNLHSRELARNYYPIYVEEGILANMAPEVRDTILILAILPQFDVRVLKKVLPYLIPESYNSYSTADYLDLIDRLQPWIEWRREGGYVLDPSFQLMLQGYIQTTQPELFRKVNKTTEKSLASGEEGHASLFL